jgi:methionyl-tRNA formyltransferase
MVRIVAFNVLPPAFRLVSDWIEQAGHQLALLVTTPGPSRRRTPTYREVIAMTPPEVDVFVTTHLRAATRVVRAVEPDLIVSFTFPYRLPPELRQIPRLGAVNLHPTPLPAYRGPNPARLVYDGWPMIGATLHWMDEEFDAGPILSQHTAPRPGEVTPESLRTAWRPLMARALAEGAERAIAGAPGDPQDHPHASYAAPFTEAERWLNWADPMRVIQRQVTALNLFGSPTARALIGGRAYLIERAEPQGGPPADPPGTILDRQADGWLVSVADGAMRVEVRMLESDTPGAAEGGGVATGP